MISDVNSEEIGSDLISNFYTNIFSATLVGLLYACGRDVPNESISRLESKSNYYTHIHALDHLNSITILIDFRNNRSMNM